MVYALNLLAATLRHGSKILTRTQHANSNYDNLLFNSSNSVQTFFTSGPIAEVKT